MQNGGQPLLQKTKQEVIFDANNADHMEAVRILFFGEAKNDQERAKLREAKSFLTIKFKLEAPYQDIRSLVTARIVAWAISTHSRKRESAVGQ